MTLTYNLYESIYDLYTLDVKSINSDRTSTLNQYRTDMSSIYDL